jgi:hypothetical protein
VNGAAARPRTVAAILALGLLLRARWALVIPIVPISDSHAYYVSPRVLATCGTYGWHAISRRPTGLPERHCCMRALCGGALLALVQHRAELHPPCPIDRGRVARRLHGATATAGADGPCHIARGEREPSLVRAAVPALKEVLPPSGASAEVRELRRGPRTSRRARASSNRAPMRPVPTSAGCRSGPTGHPGAGAGCRSVPFRSEVASREGWQHGRLPMAVPGEPGYHRGRWQGGAPHDGHPSSLQRHTT